MESLTFNPTRIFENCNFCSLSKYNLPDNNYLEKIAFIALLLLAKKNNTTTILSITITLVFVNPFKGNSDHKEIEKMQKKIEGDLEKLKCVTQKIETILEKFESDNDNVVFARPVELPYSELQTGCENHISVNQIIEAARLSQKKRMQNNN